MTEYLKPFISEIDEAHQITHLCVPNIGNCGINQTLIDELKYEYDIKITIVPFNSELFHQNCTNGVYVLIDCLDEHNIMENIGRIQRCLCRELIKYKKLNPSELPKCRKGDDMVCENVNKGSVMWTLVFIMY